MDKKISFSLSRLYKYIIESNKDFGIISAYRGNYSEKENLQRTQNLKNDIRSLGYGFVNVKGGYVETDINGVQTEVIEQSFFIPLIAFKEICNLGRKYDQETVLYKNDEYIAYVNPKNGNIEMKFKNDISTQKEKVKEYFTQFKNKGKRKFVFLSEQTEQNVVNKVKGTLDNYYTISDFLMKDSE